MRSIFCDPFVDMIVGRIGQASHAQYKFSQVRLLGRFQ